MAVIKNKKNTSVGIIPEDWDVVSISEIGQGFSYGVGAEAVPFNGQDKYIRITDIDDDSHRYKPNPIVSPAYYEERHLLKEGDIVVARTGASVGKSYLYDNKDGRLAFAGFLMKFNVHGMVPALAAYQFFTKRYWQWVNSESARTGQPGINIHQLKRFEFPCPHSFEEQKIIADALSSIDLLLVGLDEAIEKKRQIKEGLMQNLLTGVTDDWKEVSFKSIYKFAKEGGTPSTSVAEYYEPATVPFAKIDDLKDKYLTKVESYISESGLEHSSAWLLPVNCVILSNGATLGEVSINKIPVSTKQGILGIILKDEYDSEFIYYLLKGREFKKEMEKITTHGTMDCAYLKDLNTIILRVPNLDKQRSIAQTISAMDSEIQALLSKRDKYSLIKQGMMQELLTGKTRLI